MQTPKAHLGKWRALYTGLCTVIVVGNNVLGDRHQQNEPLWMQRKAVNLLRGFSCCNCPNIIRSILHTVTDIPRYGEDNLSVYVSLLVPLSTHRDNTNPARAYQRQLSTAVSLPRPTTSKRALVSTVNLLRHTCRESVRAQVDSWGLGRL